MPIAARDIHILNSAGDKLTPPYFECYYNIVIIYRYKQKKDRSKEGRDPYFSPLRLKTQTQIQFTSMLRCIVCISNPKGILKCLVQRGFSHYFLALLKMPVDFRYRR